MSSDSQRAGAGDDQQQKTPGDAGATSTVNGLEIAEEVTAPAIPPSKNQAPTTPAPPLADPPGPGAAGDPLRKPLITGGKRDIEEGAEEENEALEEIDNVLWMKDLPINQKNRCKEALDSWKKKDQLFTFRFDRKRKQSADFQNEVYQLVGFYSVFQGVLLTAVAQSNLLHCNNTWTATLLSSLASFVTVIGVILKLRSIKDLENTIAGENSTRRALVAWQLKLRTEGQNFNFGNVKTKNQQDDPETQRRDRRRARSAWWLNASFFAVIIVLILFSVGFVVSIRQILCNPGPAPY